MKNIYIIGLLCSLIFTYSCKDDDHYDPDGSIVSDKSLMTKINEISELSSFAKILEGVGYDKILDSNESFTVWAPKNRYLEGVTFETKDDSLKFVTNHIARYLYNADGAIADTVLMQNAKLMRFIGANGSYTFGGVALDSVNIVAKNGILHVIEEQLNYQPNLWEKMEDPGFDSIRTYLHSQTIMDFNQSASTIIDYNEEGIAIYDSVFVERNPFWEGYPYARNSRTLREDPTSYFDGGFYPINREDSLYSMLLPTNAAWIEAYDKIFPYFNSNAENADSVQQYYTKYALVEDLVFRGEVNTNAETVESTRLGIFTNPAELFANTTREQASNGWIYIADHLNFISTESWYKTIKIEAENTLTRDDPPTSVAGRLEVVSDQVGDLSGGSYFLNNSVQTIVTTYNEFYFPNNLSAEYDVYCVFVPDVRNADFARAPRKTKVVFTFYQLDRTTGRWQPIKSGGEVVAASQAQITPENNIVSEQEITEMLVCEKFKFPYAFINEESGNYSLKLRVETTIGSAGELREFVNRMSIDYLKLVPVQN
ncbi:MAG: fasciclin domain-containing protein [Bacteroidales bacterium]|nr:fasciclin domain-containing protein [Bacteroidales bacterium]